MLGGKKKHRFRTLACHLAGKSNRRSLRSGEALSRDDKPRSLARRAKNENGRANCEQVRQLQVIASCSLPVAKLLGREKCRSSNLRSYQVDRTSRGSLTLPPNGNRGPRNDRPDRFPLPHRGQTRRRWHGRGL